MKEILRLREGYTASFSRHFFEGFSEFTRFEITAGWLDS